MIPINENLIKSILEQLNDKYPHSIEDGTYILSDQNNREEILDHLYHCHLKGWIEAKLIQEDQRDTPAGYYQIRITEIGQNYLRSL